MAERIQQGAKEFPRSFRVLFEIEESKIVVYRILDRKEAYK